MEWKRLYCRFYKYFVLFGKDEKNILKVNQTNKKMGQQQGEIEEDNWHNSNGTMNGENGKKN
eukprot:11130525-Ditylum_brightwellii.AAC.1